jgi:hypothetical protein
MDCVVNEELIGPSDNDSELSRTIDEKCGNAVAYIGRVAEERDTADPCANPRRQTYEPKH